MISEKEFKELVKNNDIEFAIKVLKERGVLPYNPFDNAIMRFHKWVLSHNENTKNDDIQMVNSLYNAVHYLKEEQSK